MTKAKPFDIPKREVWEAFKKVKANQGAAGVDGQSIADFEIDLKNNLYKLWNRLLLEALVFAAHPFPQMEVNAVQTVVQRRLVEVTVVVDPTPDVRIYHPGKIMKGRVGPVLETPSPDFPTHCLESSVGRRGQERDAIGSVGAGRKARVSGSPVSSSR
jgi:hypothetical protein